MALCRPDRLRISPCLNVWDRLLTKTAYGKGSEPMEVFWERQNGQTEAVVRFLEEQGLHGDEGVQATVSLREDGRILACGALDGNVIKTVAVDPAFSGAGLGGGLNDGAAPGGLCRGHRQLFVLTKPVNEALFRSLSFFRLRPARTRCCWRARGAACAGIWSHCPRPVELAVRW